MSYALETKSLSKIYQSDALEVRAVDDVSIGVEQGEFVALVGPSGSGKTTMLAMLAGLLRPSEGEALINNADLSNLSEQELTKFRLQNIGFTFQSNNLVPYLNALENVQLMLRLNGKFNKETKGRAEELLVRLGLKDRLKNLPNELSGGQQQRVAIARALATDPKIILADEPTGALDTQSGEEILKIFEGMHERGITVVMVTHDPEVAMRCRRVVMIRDGLIVADGPPSEHGLGDMTYAAIDANASEEVKETA